MLDTEHYIFNLYIHVYTHIYIQVYQISSVFLGIQGNTLKSAHGGGVAPWPELAVEEKGEGEEDCPSGRTRVLLELCS